MNETTKPNKNVDGTTTTNPPSNPFTNYINYNSNTFTSPEIDINYNNLLDLIPTAYISTNELNTYSTYNQAGINTIFSDSSIGIPKITSTNFSNCNNPNVNNTKENPLYPITSQQQLYPLSLSVYNSRRSSLFSSDVDIAASSTHPNNSINYTGSLTSIPSEPTTATISYSQVAKDSNQQKPKPFKIEAKPTKTPTKTTLILQPSPSHRLPHAAKRPKKPTPFKGTIQSDGSLAPRPKNAFILYRLDNHSKIFLNNELRGMDNKEKSRILGGKWKNEKEDVKEYYRELAKKEKEEHKEKYPEYRFCPRKGGKSVVGKVKKAVKKVEEGRAQDSYNTKENVSVKMEYQNLSPSFNNNNHIDLSVQNQPNSTLPHIPAYNNYNNYNCEYNYNFYTETPISFNATTTPTHWDTTFNPYNQTNNNVELEDPSPSTYLQNGLPWAFDQNDQNQSERYYNLEFPQDTLAFLY